MKTLILFFLIALLSISTVAASNSNANMAEGGGKFFGKYVNGNYAFPQVPTTMRSSASSQIANARPSGLNPYLLTSTPASGRETRYTAHIRRASSLSNEIYKDPSILMPRYSTNHHRELKAFNPNGNMKGYLHGADEGHGYFNIYHSRNTVTGKVRGRMGDFDYTKYS